MLLLVHYVEYIVWCMIDDSLVMLKWMAKVQGVVDDDKAR